MIEVAIVLVILAVFAKIAVPKAFNPDALTLQAQARNFAANLQRAQLLAITEGIVVNVLINSDNYTVQANIGNMASQLVTLENGAAFTTGTGTLSFDSLGQPTTTNLSFQLEATGASPALVKVEPVSGLITGP